MFSPQNVCQLTNKLEIIIENSVHVSNYYTVSQKYLKLLLTENKNMSVKMMAPLVKGLPGKHKDLSLGS